MMRIYNNMYSLKYFISLQNRILHNKNMIELKRIHVKWKIIYCHFGSHLQYLYVQSIIHHHTKRTHSSHFVHEFIYGILNVECKWKISMDRAGGCLMSSVPNIKWKCHLRANCFGLYTIQICSSAVIFFLFSKTTLKSLAD